MGRVTVRTPVRRYAGGTFTSRPDTVAGEEPLEIRLGGRPLSVTMRTPGHDIDLVHGFLHAESVITEVADVAAIRYCDGVDEEGRNTYNVLDVTLADPSAGALQRTARAERNFLTSSSCGVCGKASIDALTQRMRFALPAAAPRFAPQVLTGLPATLREQQRSFASTGGVHAAALADPTGRIELVREDAGRHNAVDKVIGAALQAGRLPLGESALLTSSRASFELVQKAAMAGLAVLVAISAPSSLAVELARDRGMTLVGFTRETGFNIYAGAERIEGA